MSDRLTLDDLRSDRIGCSHFDEPVTLADWVEVGKSEGAVEVQGVEREHPNGYWVDLDTEELGLTPGRYLVKRLPEEKNNEGENT